MRPTMASANWVTLASRAAIASAHSVFEQWRATTAKARAAVLMRWHDEIKKQTVWGRCQARGY